MEIITVKMTNFRNSEHYQFIADIIALIRSLDPAKLQIGAILNVLIACHTEEGKALKKVIKSPITDRINEVDNNRDETFRGLVEANLSATKHFKVDIREAAGRLQIVFDTYGNITRIAIAEQTASVSSLVNELQLNHAADIKTVGLEEWIAELKRRNESLIALMNERYAESAAQSETVSMRKLRKETDEAYRKLVKRMNALMEIEGGETFENVIRLVNAIITRARNIIAARQGHYNNSFGKDTRP